MTKFTWFFLLFLTHVVTAQEKKIIDHTVYNSWKKIGNTKLSNNGKLAVYTIEPHRGDGFLYLVNTETGAKIDSFARASSPAFSYDSQFLIFTISAGFDTLRSCELNKVKKEKWPKDSLGILNITTNKLEKIARIKSAEIHEKLNLVYVLSEDNTIKGEKIKKKWFQKKKKEIESDGTVLTVFDLDGAKKQLEKHVTEISFHPIEKQAVYVSHQKNKKTDEYQLHVINLSSFEQLVSSSNFTEINHIRYSEKGEKIAFLASADTAKIKKYALYLIENNTIRMCLDTLQLHFPKEKKLSNKRKLEFSENGTRIFLGLEKIEKTAEKDTLLESEKARVDLWHWQDKRLQPQQLLEKKNDEKKTDLAYYDLKKEKLIFLASDSLEVQLEDHGNSDFALAVANGMYQASYNWDYPYKEDFYRLNVQNGSLELIQKGLIYGAQLSPSGRYFYYFDSLDLQIYVQDLTLKTKHCLSCSAPNAIWTEDMNGMPVKPSPIGFRAWTRGEKELVLQSKYDVWLYDLTKNELSSLTKEQGIKQKIRLELRTWESDSTYLDPSNVYLVGFHEKDKSASVYYNASQTEFDFKSVFVSKHKIAGIRKAENASNFIFQAYSIQDYPDLHVAKLEQGSIPTRLSITNPQQAEYNWATVELVSWTSYDSIPLEGLLYKPENYDPSKKYPLLVYFYEMYSDDLHNHYAPKPTASIIYPTEYASAGYFVFIPDIRYKPGHPAQGAYNCIMSGTDHILQKYPAVDSMRMGLQGQSWGGYQTAQLVTMTNRYAAAMAGAPVSNMFSAYGGMRWGSGLNRQFQYERTQSRIGKTIWEAPELYVENSPLFHLPNVKTPLLIMHNDGDGAVPWYQGIELFTGLKRLGKPAWLLNYNDDDHNLMRNANRMDLSVRMRQFFDYYLLEKPAPNWLLNGIPALEKGSAESLK